MDINMIDANILAQTDPCLNNAVKKPYFKKSSYKQLGVKF